MDDKINNTDAKDTRRVIIYLRGDLKEKVEAYMARENRKQANAVVTLVVRGLEYERQQTPAIDPLRPGTAV